MARQVMNMCHMSLRYLEKSTVLIVKSGLERLDSVRDVITKKTFREIEDSKHPLHYLMPPVIVSNSEMVLLPTYTYQLSKSFRHTRELIANSISKKF